MSNGGPAVDPFGWTSIRSHATTWLQTNGCQYASHWVLHTINSHIYHRDYCQTATCGFGISVIRSSLIEHLIPTESSSTRACVLHMRFCLMIRLSRLCGTLTHQLRLWRGVNASRLSSSCRWCRFSSLRIKSWGFRFRLRWFGMESSQACCLDLAGPNGFGILASPQKPLQFSVYGCRSYTLLGLSE